jgi:thiol-disulfide isomerase/thioredoxin
MILALALVLSIPQTPAAPLSAPAQCVKDARDFSMAQQKALGTSLTRAAYDKIEADKKEMAKACAAKIDVASLNAAGKVAMAELYGETGEPAKATAMLTALLADKSEIPTAVRADALVRLLRTGLMEPKGEARNARLEGLVDQLDALGPAAFDQQLSAHTSMNNYYRADDIDAGIIKHSTWIINASKTFTPEQKQKLAPTVASAHVYMAEAWAGQAMTPRALALLREGAAAWGSLPYGRGMTIKEVLFDDEIARLELVGLPAAALTAPAWFNKPANSNELAMPGHVTLLEFTAHWCGPCRESYPGVNRLRAKYAPQGFRVAMATRLYGYFGSEQNLPADVEIAKDKAYFAEHELGDIPVAIGPKIDIKTVNGKTEYIPGKDPNDVAYRVGGIPQIMLIDKKGKIRLIMVGYDDVNEPRLAKMIEDLLNEK